MRKQIGKSDNGVVGQHYSRIPVCEIDLSDQLTATPTRSQDSPIERNSDDGDNSSLPSLKHFSDRRVFSTEPQTASGIYADPGEHIAGHSKNGGTNFPDGAFVRRGKPARDLQRCCR
jgi:hypothetical protein